MLALARKYRPSTLKDLIGQEVFVDVIKNAIEMKRIHHAFLLTGTRGVGKTTSARILALSLNCIGHDGNGSETAEPCLECDICKSILSGTNQDIIEFDAASNTGVDAIRDIIEQCNFAPMMSRYKIYIVDEVHMLSKSAFNALLKTLEEPPSRVKFIFATTEIKKVPVTILSRCQKFYLGNISEEKILNHLEFVLKSENIANFDKNAISLIAKHANGSMRDGLSLLDQAINVSNGKLDMQSVQNMLSLPDSEQLAILFYKLYLGYSKEALEIAQELLNKNNNHYTLISELLNLCCYSMMYIENIKNDKLSNIEQYLQKLSDSNVLNMPRILRMWQIVSNSLQEISLINQDLYIASLVFKLCYINTTPTPIEMLKTINNPLLQEAFSHFPDGKIVK